MMVKRFLVFLLCGTTGFAASENRHPPAASKQLHSIEFKIDLEGEPQTHRGTFSELYIASDWVKGGSNPEDALAFIQIGTLGEERSRVPLVRVITYEDSCLGSPISYISYTEMSHGQGIMPQVAAVSRDTCSEIEIYRRSGEEIELAEQFNIRVR